MIYEESKRFIFDNFFTIFTLGIGVTYSFYLPKIVNVGENNSVIISNNGININYMNNSKVLINSSISQITKTIIVENSLNFTQDYKLSFDNVINTLPDISMLKYSYTCTSNYTSCESRSDRSSPTLDYDLTTAQNLSAYEKHTYSITFTLTGSLTTELFSSTIKAKEVNYLTNRLHSSDTRYFWGYRTSISNITFENVIDVPVNAFQSWDVSHRQNGSIMAYIIDDGL